MWMIFLKVAGGSVGRGRREIHRIISAGGGPNQMVRKFGNNPLVPACNKIRDAVSKKQESETRQI